MSKTLKSTRPLYGLAVSFLVSLALVESQALACSSCGNGSSNPLYLYPYEVNKVYLGWTLESDFQDVSYDGEEMDSLLLRERQTLTVAVGTRVHRRAFISVRGSRVKQTSQGSGQSVWTYADPSLHLRYAVYHQMLSSPWVPQLELFAGYKKSVSRSPAATRHREMLDATGSGFDDLNVGFDVWSGMTPVQFGFSLVYSYAMSESMQDGDQHPGNTTSLSLSIGQTWDWLKLVVGTVQNRRTRRTHESQVVQESDSSQNNLFLTTDFFVAANTVRFSVLKNAAFGTNRSTSRSSSYTVAFMRSF